MRSFTKLLAVLTLTSSLWAQTPQIDGTFDDWKTPSVTIDDPSGDGIGAFDLTKVQGNVVGSEFYLRLNLTKKLNLQSGAKEDGTLLLNVELPRDRELQIDFRRRQAVLTGPEAASSVAWRNLRFLSLPTYASTEFELRFDLKDFGVRVGDKVSVAFDGSDELSESVSLVANDSKSELSGLPKTTRVKDTLRIASINTLRSGLSDSQRTDGFKALLEFAEADVYCFNEEWDQPKFEEGVSNVLGPTKLTWNGGCGITSRFPLKPLDLGLNRGCAGLVEVAEQPPVLVIAVHFKCCGFAGSREDIQRISEAQQVADAIRRIEKGDYGKDAMNAGIVVIGDFNLVGSRKPLTIIEDAGMKEVLLRSPVDGTTATWRSANPRDSFWPGRLDCLTIESDRLVAAQSFCLHPLRAGELVPKLKGSTPLSDHCLLVVDLKSLE